MSKSGWSTAAPVLSLATTMGLALLLDVHRSLLLLSVPVLEDSGLLMMLLWALLELLLCTIGLVAGTPLMWLAIWTLLCC